MVVTPAIRVNAVNFKIFKTLVADNTFLKKN